MNNAELIAQLRQIAEQLGPEGRRSLGERERFDAVSAAISIVAQILSAVAK